jgi:hypothetical protein
LISPAEAILLLKGLKDKVTPVRVNLVTPSARCAFEGLVSEVSDLEVMIMVPQQLRVSCAMQIQLEGARFEWGDTRQAPPAVRQSIAKKFSSALSILLPDGTLAVISELNA